jgi:hypothetical protein
MNLSQAYADIADCAVAMSGARSGTQSATEERRVA